MLSTTLSALTVWGRLKDSCVNYIDLSSEKLMSWTLASKASFRISILKGFKEQFYRPTFRRDTVYLLVWFYVVLYKNIWLSQLTRATCVPSLSPHFVNAVPVWQVRHSYMHRYVISFIKIVLVLQYFSEFLAVLINWKNMFFVSPYQGYPAANSPSTYAGPGPRSLRVVSSCPTPSRNLQKEAGNLSCRKFRKGLAWTETLHEHGRWR